MKSSFSRATALKWLALVPAAVSGFVASLSSTAGAADNKKQFKYVDKSTKKGQTCANCRFFKAPHACTIVSGKIQPGGWCIAWAKK